MKNAILILLTLLLVTCKKNEERPLAPATVIPNPTMPPDTTNDPKPCKKGYYGGNCDSAYGILMSGAWLKYDSVEVDYSGSTPTLKFAGSHDVIIYDSGYSTYKTDTFKQFFISNFWGNGERAAIEVYRDTVIFYTPTYKGKSTYSRSFDDAILCIANNYTYTFKDNSTFKDVGVQSCYTHIKMTRK